MYKWTNNRGYYVTNPSNSSHTYGGVQHPQLVNISDQHIVTNPEQYNINLEDKINAMLRVTGEMAEMISQMQSGAQNDQYQINEMRNNIRNISDHTNSLSPYTLQEIQDNINRLNMNTKSLVDEIEKSNPQLIGTLKLLVSLAQSDKLNDLFKVMTILTQK